MSEEITKLPKFKDEAEEAQWWFDNQDIVLKMFQKAEAEGRLGHGTVMKQLAEKRLAAKSTTIRLDPSDVSLAKSQAQRKGLRYQTYLKMLIHEASSSTAPNHNAPSRHVSHENQPPKAHNSLLITPYSLPVLITGQ